MVDAFARYRITDPLKFYQTIGPAGASSQLAILLNSTLRRVLGGATLADVVRNKREELMALMRDQLDRDAQPFGIHVPIKPPLGDPCTALRVATMPAFRIYTVVDVTL